MRFTILRALKEKNVGTVVHLIRGVGGKALSTLKWESGLRGADFVRIRPPRKLKNKVRL